MHRRKLQGSMGSAVGEVVNAAANAIGTDIELGIDEVDDNLVAAGAQFVVAVASSLGETTDVAGLAGSAAKAAITLMPDEVGGVDISGAKNVAYAAVDATQEIIGYATNPVSELGQAAVKFGASFAASDADSLAGRVGDGLTGASSTLALGVKAVSWFFEDPLPGGGLNGPMSNMNQPDINHQLGGGGVSLDTSQLYSTGNTGGSLYGGEDMSEATFTFQHEFSNGNGQLQGGGLGGGGGGC